jgi:hypothetical protein
MTWGRQDSFSPDDTLHQNATFLVASPIGVIRDDGGGQLSDVPGTTLPPPIGRPATLNNVKAVVIQYEPPSGEDGHFVAFRVAAAIADWKAFVTSFFATGTPTIP